MIKKKSKKRIIFYNNTSRPTNRTLRVRTWTSFEMVEKSVVQNTTKSLKPSGDKNFPKLKACRFCDIFWSTGFRSIAGNAEISDSVVIWCFGGRLNGLPTNTRIFCISDWTPWSVGPEGKDSTVVEHLFRKKKQE